MVTARRKKTFLKSLVEHWTKASAMTKILLITTLVGGTTGSIVGISQAYPIVEPYWYVARHELRLVMDRQALATDRQTLFQLQEYLDRAKKDPAARSSPVVKQRIEDLTRQIGETDARIKKAVGN